MNGDDIRQKLTAEEFDHLMEHNLIRPVENTSFERHTQTVLTSIIVLLLAGLVTFIFRISDNQDSFVVEMRVLQFQVKAISDSQIGTVGNIQREIVRLEKSLDTVWPRVRAHGENSEIIVRHFETLCRFVHKGEGPSRDSGECTVTLNDPEQF